MRGGRLRKRLQVQTYSATRDAHGGQTKVWSTQETRWGAIEPTEGKEIQIADGMPAARITHKVTMRFYPGLNSAMRIVYVDNQQDPIVNRVFEIKSVLNLDERRIQQVLMCTEGKPNS